MTDENLLKDLMELFNLEGVCKVWCAEAAVKLLEITQSASNSITTRELERCVHVITYDDEKWLVERKIENLREQNKLHTDIKILVSERDDRINLF